MSGGGSGGGTTTSTTQNYSPEEAAQRAKVQSEAATIYDSTKGKITSSPYPGAAVAPVSAETAAAQNYITNYAANDAVAGVNSINNGVNYGLNGAMDVENNPYLAKAIDAATRPITEKYVDPNGVLANIRSEATQTGQYGGTRQGLAEGVAAGRYASEVGDVAAKMSSDAYNTGQNTFAKTLAFAPTALQTGMLPAEMMSSVGAQKENLTQQQLDYESQAQMWDLNKEWAPLQNYANIVFGGSTPGTTATSNGGSSGGRSTLGGMAGGAMMGYQVAGPYGAAAGALMSLL